MTATEPNKLAESIDLICGKEPVDRGLIRFAADLSRAVCADECRQNADDDQYDLN
jgi:hypothetical protein